MTEKTPNIVFVDCVLRSLEQIIVENRGGLPARILKMSAGSPVAAINLGLLFSFIFLSAIGIIIVSFCIFESIRVYTASITASFQISLERIAAHQPVADVIPEIVKAATELKLHSDLSLPIVTVFYCGFLGGVTSIIPRISNIRQTRDADLVTLFCTAVFKPIIGGVFGLVIFAIFHLGITDIIRPDMQPDLNRASLWVVVGFLCGFSERFASDMIMRTEAAILPTRHPNV